MADVRNDPSMEDILASIKRIIADDTATAMDAPRPRGRSAHPAAARTVTTTPAAPAAAEVLELTEELPDAGTDADEPIIDRPKAWPAFTVAEPPHTAIEIEAEADTVEPELISTATAEASRQAFASLASRVVKPAPGDDQTLEGLVREMLRPMLKEWLDARLPELVEGVVQREIARIAGRTL